MEGLTFSLESFAPITFDLDTFFRVLKRLLEILQIVLGGRSVTIDGMIGGIVIDSLSIELNGFLVTFCFKLSVSKFFGR